MTFDWKIPAVAAGGAFLLSFFIGLAGHVGFGILVLRAVIWGVVFGALAFGIDQLFRKYLPEIYGNEAADLTDDPMDVTKDEERTVDITLEEENPVTVEGSSDDGESRDEIEGSDESVGASAEEEGLVVENDRSEEVEELETIDEPGKSAGESESDDIPEGEFADFEAVETTFSDSSVEEDTGARHVESVDVLGIDEDPETVARAVRTFMKKDQEG